MQRPDELDQTSRALYTANRRQTFRNKEICSTMNATHKIRKMLDTRVIPRPLAKTFVKFVEFPISVFTFDTSAHREDRVDCTGNVRSTANTTIAPRHRAASGRVGGRL